MHVTELMTLAVKVGLEDKADEWMRLLVERRAECVETLDREKMHYESIFRSVRDGRMYLSWFSVQGSTSEPVRGSPHPIDELHTRYWDPCIDRAALPQKFEHVVSFVPLSVAQAIHERHAAPEQACGLGLVDSHA
jgi:hypothetical protein